MLTSPVQDGDAVVLVASYGGDDRHPQWFLNLRDNPEVEITMDGKTRPMRARVPLVICEP
jgi:deazaflavin-dependent oxidoreductase (nitroreductase family)